ncbi:MAG: GTP-binding protein [Clostridia bacterium]|nr:GTP-binding protein [Clostridia bacterium]
MAKQQVPVYIICGFLESGKTNFIAPMMTGSDFTDGERTLLVVTEEGEEEYDEEAMSNYKVRMSLIEDEEDFNKEALTKLDNKYHPTQVLIELNGMWDMGKVFAEKALPDNWAIYQVVTTVDSTTFDAYSKNIAQQMSQHIMSASMVIFNRCTPELAETLRSRNLKMLNRRAEMYLEYTDGHTEEYDDGTPPFDLDVPVLELSDDDYGVWYVDVMTSLDQHPDRYEGKSVSFLAQVAKDLRFGRETMAVGRQAMVCCADDTQFMGVLAKGPETKDFKSKDWVKVQGKIKIEKHILYRGIGPILYIEKIERAEAPAPEDQLVSY